MKHKTKKESIDNAFGSENFLVNQALQQKEIIYRKLPCKVSDIRKIIIYKLILLRMLTYHVK